MSGNNTCKCLFLCPYIKPPPLLRPPASPRYHFWHCFSKDSFSSMATVSQFEPNNPDLCYKKAPGYIIKQAGVVTDSSGRLRHNTWLSLRRVKARPFAQCLPWFQSLSLFTLFASSIRSFPIQASSSWGNSGSVAD